MILIYSDSQIIDLEWLPNIAFNDEYTVSHSFEEYLNSPVEQKIAFTTHRLHCDYDTNCAAYQGFEDKINQLSAVSRFVFTLESELHDFHWQIFEQCHHENVYWLLPGFVNDRDDINKNIICWGDWFKTTATLYKNLPNKLNELVHYQNKPRYFDALLGSPKPHRDFVAHAVMDNAMNDRFILTYGGDWLENDFYARDYFIWDEGTEPVGTVIGTADWARYHGQMCHISQIIPIQVYNDTAYSVVAETDFDNTLSCFTEKTAKVMIGRRPFVVFSGYKFLHNLRRLGFRTFDGIIDESYDLILDDTARYTAAFEQIKRLCSQDQTTVLEQARDTLEHNHNLIMTRDWTQWSADQISQVVG